MSEDEIGFSEISDVHRNERRSKVLTKLPKMFYEMTEEHLAGLKTEYDIESRNPSNPKAMMLHDNINKLDKRMREIYERRERKIVVASLGSARPPENMTQNDRALFNELAEVLAYYRTGNEPRTPKSRVPVTKEEPVPAVIPVEPVGDIVESQTQFMKEEEIKDEGTETNAAIVQVLEDIPPFVDMDHTYNLKKNDVVTLPNQFASLLSSKGKVRNIES